MKLTLDKLFDRIAARITLEKDTGCWIVGDCKIYAQISVNGNLFVLTRLIYSLLKGPIPEGNDICHTCDTPGCVNPHHLFAGTRKDNIQDAIKKGRMHWQRPLLGDAGETLYQKESSTHSTSSSARVATVSRALSKGQSFKEIKDSSGMSEESLLSVIIRNNLYMRGKN